MSAQIQRWAQSHPIIRYVYVFGSRASETARVDSDLDLIVSTDEIHGSELSEIIERCSIWKAELAERLGIEVKDIYPPDSAIATAAETARVLVYRRNDVAET